jgi:SAM-dependent methyltransferase
MVLRNSAMSQNSNSRKNSQLAPQADMHTDAKPGAGNAIDALNKSTMNAAARSHYAVSRGLKDAEAAALKLIADEVRGQAVLDLGFGGGRTVEPLMELSEDYIGLDYAQAMVDITTSLYPGVDLRHGDARDLSQFNDDCFFLVVFSCEGICMVDHAGRMAILAEVLRVLKPGGIFLFSTMNQESDYHTRGFQFPDFQASLNPARLAVRSARFARGTASRLVNRLKYKKRDMRADRFSIINDVYHDYATMIYYISLANQRRQLEAVGFQPHAIALDLKGEVIEKDSSDNTLTLIARKPRSVAPPP